MHQHEDRSHKGRPNNKNSQLATSSFPFLMIISWSIPAASATLDPGAEATPSPEPIGSQHQFLFFPFTFSCLTFSSFSTFVPSFSRTFFVPFSFYQWTIPLSPLSWIAFVHRRYFLRIPYRKLCHAFFVSLRLAPCIVCKWQSVHCPFQLFYRALYSNIMW